MSSVRTCQNTRKFCGFCMGFIPVPVTSVSSVRVLYPYPELLFVLYSRFHHNTRNFCGFCKGFIPVPGTSVSSVRHPYPDPKSTNPTEPNLGRLCSSSLFQPFSASVVPIQPFSASDTKHMTLVPTPSRQACQLFHSFLQTTDLLFQSSTSAFSKGP